METGQQQSREVATLAAVAHQLVQDVGEDQNSYQQAFGPRSICLPAVTCRSCFFYNNTRVWHHMLLHSPAPSSLKTLMYGTICCCIALPLLL